MKTQIDNFNQLSELEDLATPAEIEAMGPAELALYRVYEQLRADMARGEPLMESLTEETRMAIASLIKGRQHWVLIPLDKAWLIQTFKFMMKIDPELIDSEVVYPPLVLFIGKTICTRAQLQECIGKEVQENSDMFTLVTAGDIVEDAEAVSRVIIALKLILAEDDLRWKDAKVH